MNKLSVLMAVLAWLAMALPALAATITIDDRTDSITITWDGFDEGGVTGGFAVNGDADRTEKGSKTVQEGQAITFDGKWRAFAAGSGGGTINFLESGTIVNGVGTISDILTISWSITMNNAGQFLAVMSGSFTSDSDPPNLGADTGIVETGSFQSVGYQSNVPNLGNPDHLFINVASDPEPSTLALLGIGIAGMLLRRRKSA